MRFGIFSIFTPTAEQVMAFQPSEILQNRLRDPLQGNRNGTLTAEERAKLEEFCRITHFLSMLKIRARKHIKQ
jgi:hypothetical protein